MSPEKDAEPEKAGQYFRHMEAPRFIGGALCNATRYLCAATYLSRSFGDRVIGEYVENPHRAVPPSYGFDLAPVVAHGLEARRLRFLRDAWCTGLVVVLFFLNPFLTSVALALVALTLVPWYRLRTSVRILLVLGSVVVSGMLLLTAFAYVAGSFLSSALDPFSGGYGLGSGYGDEPEFGEFDTAGYLEVANVLWPIVALSLLAAPFFYRIAVVRALMDLGSGSKSPVPSPKDAKTQHRLSYVAGAQHGNVTLYSNENPFVGSGSHRSRAWSVTIELDRAADSTKPIQKVDPVALHDHVRKRVLEIRGDTDQTDGLPANERVEGLVVDYQVVARGWCRQGKRPAYRGEKAPTVQGHPLIDWQSSMPFSMASPTAVEAVIRHPQANLRCFQRVTISTPGQPVFDGDRFVAPAEDHDLLLSGFLYLAVEGNMLYGQFVANALPPVHRAFRIVDVLALDKRSRAPWKALQLGGFRALLSGFYSPYFFIRDLADKITTAAKSSDLLPAHYFAYDFGSQMSARELAAESEFHEFMDDLDANKYTRMIERRINEAMIDYLRNVCNVNVDSYREQAAQITNNGVVMTGGTISNSQVAAAGGLGGNVSQQASPPAAKPDTGT